MIEEVEIKIAQMVSEIDYAPAVELFERIDGGKRLRAKLILLIASSSKDAVHLAAIIELIHTASLLHDDVIDSSELRRGKPSLNATDGSKVAVMMGDLLYSKAFSELTQLDMRIAKTVADAVTSLSVGEMLDVQLAKSFSCDEERYLKMLYLKTGVLIEASAKSAAMLENKDSDRYATYGKNLGVSFQIIDDILDIVSDDSTLGKPSFGDFKEGKTTLPYIYLYNQLDDEKKLKLKSLHLEEPTDQDKLWLKEQMHIHGSIEKTYKKARQLSDIALNSIENESELVQVIESMMKRTF